jgi:hypothetical protein
LSFLIGLAVGIPLSLWLTSGPDESAATVAFASSVLGAVLLYSSLFVLYMPFYYVVVASLSVQTLVLAGRQPGRAMSLRALEEKFASSQLVEQRLRTMAENKLSRATQEGYALTARGRLVARAFDFLKGFWKLGPGG